MKNRFVIAIAAISLGLVGIAFAGAPPADPIAAYAPCSTCHEDLAKSFVTNPHADAKGACAACHGDGAKHAAEGDKTLIKVPAAIGDIKTCLGCHEGTKVLGRAGTGMHASASVACFTCHSVHGATQPTRLLKRPINTLCASCHLEQAGMFKKPFAHHLDGDAMTCASCHNPHGGRGLKSLKASRLGDGPCMTCHPDKQGPFVFSHVNGVNGNCLSCHEPHGSNNPMRLRRARVDQLCLECHTTLPAGNLGSQPPSFHDLRSPRYTNCTTCHVAVHGSNSSPLLLK
jgi:DmsE family decaheme c-type cytochrome